MRRQTLPKASCGYPAPFGPQTDQTSSLFLAYLFSKSLFLARLIVKQDLMPYVSITERTRKPLGFVRGQGVKR
jgi:hypothetical protein